MTPCPCPNGADVLPGRGVGAGRKTEEETSISDGDKKLRENINKVNLIRRVRWQRELVAK